MEDNSNMKIFYKIGLATIGSLMVLVGCSSDIILESESDLRGDYVGTYTIIEDFGSNLAKEHTQPITWKFTDTTYIMQIDTSKEYDPGFSICRVDGRYALSEGVQLAEVHSIPDPFTACKDKNNPTGLFILTKSAESDTLTMKQNDGPSATFKEIKISRIEI